MTMLSGIETSKIEVGVLFSVILPVLTLATNPNIRIAQHQMLERLLSKEVYDKGVRAFPDNFTDSATVVNVNLYVRNIQHISDVEMDYQIQGYFRMDWIDKRLSYDKLLNGQGYGSVMPSYLWLDHRLQSEIWVPDLLFINEKPSHAHDSIQPNKNIKIFPDGQVKYSVSLTLTLSCPMMFKLYPFDMQTCELRMENGFTTDDIIFKWKLGNPVHVSSTYSCLQLELQFRREPHYMLIQVFIPSCLLILIGWLSFWLDSKSGSGRLTLSLLTLLLYIVMVVVLNDRMPHVSYTTAMDVWTGTCLTFLFFALFEFVLVNYLARRNDNDGDEIQTKSNSIKYKETSSALDAFDFWTLSDTIDALARVLYPVFFVLFAILYEYNYRREYTCQKHEGMQTKCFSE